jgi:hypothetical protein
LPDGSAHVHQPPFFFVFGYLKPIEYAAVILNRYFDGKKNSIDLKTNM